MKKIILKKLKLVNFKGIKELVIDFSECTNIYGANGTGKTTIFDAFTWLLFGKNSSDKKDFNVKTLDKNNDVIPKIEHEVEAVLLVNDVEVTLKSILKEKWVTKKGALEPEFKGNETTYFFNDVPMKQEEYKKKISEIIDEKLFKIITNPTYFNNLKWQDMRAILFELVPLKTNKEIAQDCTGIEYLVEIFDTKTIDEYKKEVLAKKKKINSELDAIPVRIDEVIKGTPENENWGELEKQISEKTDTLNKINEQINNANIPSENDLKIKKEINNIKSEMLEIRSKTELEFANKRNSLSENITAIKNEISETELNIKSCGRRKSSVQKEINESNELIEKYRNNIKELNDKVFDESTTFCQTCGRAFEPDKIEEMKIHFEENKKAEYYKFNEKGKNLKNGLIKLKEMLDKNKSEEEALNKKLENLQKELNQRNSEYSSLEKPKIDELEEYIKMQERIFELESQKDKPVDISELQEARDKISSVLEDLKSSISKKEMVIKSQQRIQELEVNQKQLAQKKADLDKLEFDIQKFIKFKIENFENTINAMFKLVKFKLFETQINGAETECCKSVVDGVPFNDLNNAMKLNAGIDIINTLCGKYGVYAPIFIDNRESVTDIIDCESQIINLIVSKDDKKLRVEAN